jgi:DMSO reductase anchor subunit
MFKHSWLSREVITLSLSVAFTMMYLGLFYYGASGDLRMIAGGLGILANMGFYLSSAMVYASVRFIREWSNAFTPINFLLFGVTSGFAVNFAVAHYAGVDYTVIHGINRVLLVFGAVSLTMKVLSYRFNSNVYVSVNIKNAVGINDPDIKLMDMGTPYDHYNTKEYYHPLSEKTGLNAKNLIITVTFILPVIIWSVTVSNLLQGFSPVLSILAAVLMMTGLVFERRLFFMHGNNLQNMYYGNFRSTGARNPLLRKAKKGTPVPVK